MKGCVAEPLLRLADDVQSFVRRPELRALHVAADGHLWLGALRVVLGGEHLADNRSPWLSIEVPPPGGDPWVEMEARLVREHEALREAGAPLEPLQPEVAGVRGAGRCAARILQAAASVRAPAEGLVLVLLAADGASPPWLSQLADTMLDPGLGQVRWVLVTPLDPAAIAWSAALPGVLSHACAVDRDAAADELEAELEAEATGGGAWPTGVTPPPRPSAQSAGAASASAGAVSASAGGSASGGDADPMPDDSVPRCVRRAVLAMQRGQGPEAVRQQARARDLCHEAGRHEDAVRMELVLGGYLLQLHEPEPARASFGRAAARAAELDAAALQAQACYAEAWAWREERRDEAALRCYWAGIEAAKRGGEVTLMFEGYWEAGRVLQPLGRTRALVSLWSDAIHSAGQHPPHALRGTRIGDIARELAQVLRDQRRPADARAVDEWAAAVTGGADAHAHG